MAKPKVGQVYTFHWPGASIKKVAFLDRDEDGFVALANHQDGEIYAWDFGRDEDGFKFNFRPTKKTVSVFKKKRSDGFTFFLVVWNKKRVTISAGCQGEESVQAALKLWSDDHKVDESIDERHRIKLNRESRKIVLSLCKKAGVKIPKGDWT